VSTVTGVTIGDMCEDRAMKAIRIHEDGGPDVLRYEDVPDPEPAAGEVLIRLRAASLNHLDLWVRKGLPSVPKPRILGADGAGTVEALGEGVEGFEIGQRVVVNPGLVHGDTIGVVGEHGDGTHCELFAIDAGQVFALDDALSFEQAAAFPLVYETAYRMLVTKAQVQEGEWALIWGIGGGVSTAAFEICRALGVRTIVTSGSEEKLAAAREWGADVVVDHAEGDVVAAVKEATGKGVHVVVESVGEATWARTLAAVRPAGRIVVCGATTGPNPPAALHRFWWKQLTLMGSMMGTREDFLGVYELVRSGRARVHVDSVFPLAETAAAHERMEAGAQLGKIVLAIPG
jgi:NADPH:quinone reductase-like Zn-dependent oxidoreductase